MSLLLTQPELSTSCGTNCIRRRIFAGIGNHRTPKFARYRPNLCALNPNSPVPVLRAYSASPPPLRQQMEGGDDKDYYYVNLGNAIRTLREDYPILFYKEPCFSIYRDDIVFKDPLNTFVGIDNYKQIFSALRFIGPVLFKVLWIDIVSVWQPIENTIMIRWTVHGIRRMPWGSHGRFDGISVYKVDRKGKIFEHRVSNIARNPPTRFKITAVDELIQSLSSSSTPKPTYFETSLSDNISMPFLRGFLFVGYYFVVCLSVVFSDVCDNKLSCDLLYSCKFCLNILI